MADDEPAQPVEQEEPQLGQVVIEMGECSVTHIPAPTLTSN